MIRFSYSTVLYSTAVGTTKSFRTTCSTRSSDEIRGEYCTLHPTVYNNDKNSLKFMVKYMYKYRDVEGRRKNERGQLNIFTLY